MAFFLRSIQVTADEQPNRFEVRAFVQEERRILRCATQNHIPIKHDKLADGTQPEGASAVPRALKL
jgi:hypothetical protein